MSSRIFIRGLPPRYSDNELKKHFSQTSQITDCKYIPHRRIAYVGYKTVEDAQKAVDYFNRTFIRMSRINVEIARAIDDSLLPRPWSAHTPGSTAYQKKQEEAAKKDEKPTDSNDKPNLKRKRDHVVPSKDEIAADPKLQEFLSVMGPQSKNKTWTNDDLVTLMQGPKEVQVPVVEANDTDDEYETIPALTKKPTQQATIPIQPEIVNNVQPILTRTDDDNKDTDMNDESTEDKAPVSDADWLRGKTSRLLDLAEEDDTLLARLDQPTGGQESIPRPAGQDYSMEDVEQTDRQTSPEKVSEKHEAREDAQPSERDVAIQTISETGRLFVRNLAYTATEDDLREHFASYGTLKEVHLPVDAAKKATKGFGYILYEEPTSAIKAFESLDKTIFQGRLLHILAAAPKRDNKLDEFALSKLPLKKQRELKKKMAASTSSFNWNSMYMNADAVMSSIAHRLGVSKSEILDPTSADAAVVQAHAETNIIQETKAYFKVNGIDLTAFERKQKDDRVILIKNFPFGTRVDELKDMLIEFGPVNRVLMPPAGTIAVAEFQQAPHARAAFASLAYRRFKDSILFLEKGPKDLFIADYDPAKALAALSTADKGKSAKLSATELLEAATPDEAVSSSSLYVRNLSFNTTQQAFTELFKPLDGFLTARVKTKPDPKNPGKTLSMGFGFVEFRTKEQAAVAMAALNGHTLDGHQLAIKASHKGLDAVEERKKDEKNKKAAMGRTKLIVKNLPFEATKKDIMSLFSQYGKLRSIRMPKKFGSHSRGFAFAEFITTKDAQTAMDSLRDTHLLGRKLVIDYAEQDAADAEEEIERMTKKAKKNEGTLLAHKYRETQKRSKFEIAGAGEDDGLTGE